MAHDEGMISALTPAIVLLTAGLVAIAAARQLRLSPIVGFLAAGVALGPSGFSLVEENETTELLAKLGVVFLMFEIGMHFTLRTLRENRADMLTLAPLQYFITGAAFTLLAHFAFGIGLAAAIAIGGALAISSTAVVARVLVERNQGACPVGRSAINILVFQDIFAVFLLIYSASLAAGSSVGPLALGTDLLIAAGKTVIGFAAALIVGPLVLQPVFAFMARGRQNEAFTAIALLLALTLAALAVYFDLTETLGGFLAGMMIGATRYRHVIEAEAKPFRNLLLSFFFISIGMLVDLRALAEVWPVVLALVVGIVGVKLAGAYLAARLSGWTVPGSTQLSSLLAQGSEFSFIVLATPAVAVTLTSAQTTALITSIALSLAVTPTVANAGARLARKLAKKHNRVPLHPPDVSSQPDASPILLFGMDDVGRRTADALTAHDIPFISVDNDPERFARATADGYDVAFGDPSDLRVLEAVAARPRAVALAYPRFEQSEGVTPLLAEQNPGLARFVAVADDADVARHLALGMIPVRDVGSPRGLAFAARLLSFAGVESERIAAWVATERRRLMADPDTTEVLTDRDDADPADLTPAA